MGVPWSGSRPSRIDSPSAEVVDPADVLGRAQPVEVRRVAARDDAERDAELRFDRDREGRELTHVAIVGNDAVATGEVRADAANLDVREREAARDGVVDVARA